jgi:flavin reductase (DIM6/NTAB) family NADH-FMN oxidoreductase RutF
MSSSPLFSWRRVLRRILQTGHIPAQSQASQGTHVHNGGTKEKLGPTTWMYPTPVVLCGANVNGKPNYATVGACGVISLAPPLIYVSLVESHYTTEGIAQNRTFSFNFPATPLKDVTDYCGLVSGREVDKSKLFSTFYGELGTAPMIQECPVTVECRVDRDLRIHGRAVFIGEVVQVHADKRCVVERRGRRELADMPILDPLIYARDNRYYKCGPVIGTAYRDGMGYR